jgi:hypothetical protein
VIHFANDFNVDFAPLAGGNHPFGLKILGDFQLTAILDRSQLTALDVPRFACKARCGGQ